MTDVDRVQRWNRILDQLGTGSPSEPLVLDEAMIRQWLQEHRAEYNSSIETVKACLSSFRLHRRHRKMVWDIYSRTDFSHLKLG